jgi:ABC-type multidrug transport system ATPase subunit
MIHALSDALNGFVVVLGRPGSGCSTFLKTLANQRGEYHAVAGEVHYDSLSPDDIAKHYRGDVTYCPEDDGQPNSPPFFSLARD